MKKSFAFLAILAIASPVRAGNFLDGFYLQAGLAGADHLPVTLTHVSYDTLRAADQAVNPYGVLEAGWTLALSTSFTLEFAARHFSSPSIDLEYGRTYQRGMDTIEFRLRWRPFARE